MIVFLSSSQLKVQVKTGILKNQAQDDSPLFELVDFTSCFFFFF